MKRGLTTIPLFLFLALVLTFAGFQAIAEEPQAAEQQQPAQQLTEDGYLATTVAGIQVFVDPATGRMRPPSPEEAAALATAMKRMFNEPLKHSFNHAPVTYADGTIGMVLLDPTYQNFSVVRVENGELHASCVDGLHNALDVIDNPAPVAPTAQPEEK